MKNKNNYLSFVIDDKTLAVPVLSLQSIIGNPNITQIASTSTFIVGTFYINNFYIPILDLRMILNKPKLLHPKNTCVIIVRVKFKGLEKLVGFVVDSLFSIHNIQVSDVEKLPACEGNESIDGINYQKDKMILLLNLEKVINEKNVIYFLNKFWGISEQNSNIYDYMSEKNGI